MQDKLFININASSKIIILCLLILMLFITNSIYLILFITTLTLILMILYNISVKEYVTYIKNIFLFLLFVILAYIIVFREYSILGVISFIYKMFLSVVLFKIILFNLSFQDLHTGIYTLMKPLKKWVKNLEELSFDISIGIHYLICFFNSGNKIKQMKSLKTKKKGGIKYTIFPQLILVDNEIKEFKNYLKLNFYKLKKENKNLKSTIYVCIIVVICIVAVFKEVIK